MARNPKWTRDELILAMDLYFEVNPSHTSEKNPQIVALSHLLNQLPIHPRSKTNSSFRNPNGVYMKMCNYLRLDPEYRGTGLASGSELDEAVWDEFYPNLKRLRQVANAIRENYKYLTPPGERAEDAKPTDEDDEFPEGKILFRLHKIKERNPSLVKAKKDKVFKTTGRLGCEICNFDFKEFYGKQGQGFAECHHNNPVSDLDTKKLVKISELSIVCANCHRMIHRIRPWLKVEELRNILVKRTLQA